MEKESVEGRGRDLFKLGVTQGWQLDLQQGYRNGVNSDASPMSGDLMIRDSLNQDRYHSYQETIHDFLHPHFLTASLLQLNGNVKDSLKTPHSPLGGLSAAGGADRIFQILQDYGERRFCIPGVLRWEHFIHSESNFLLLSPVDQISDKGKTPQTFNNVSLFRCLKIFPLKFSWRKLKNLDA